jgi:hypothetical protein
MALFDRKGVFASNGETNKGVASSLTITLLSLDPNCYQKNTATYQTGSSLRTTSVIVIGIITCTGVSQRPLQALQLLQVLDVAGLATIASAMIANNTYLQVRVHDRNHLPDQTYQNLSRNQVIQVI